MRRALISAFSALALLLTAGGAAAEGEATPPPEPLRRTSAEILAHAEQPEAQASWQRVSLHPHWGHFLNSMGNLLSAIIPPFIW